MLKYAIRYKEKIFLSIIHTTNNTSQRIPCSIVKPIVEVVKAFFSQISGGPVVEVRVELVDDALET